MHDKLASRALHFPSFLRYFFLSSFHALSLSKFRVVTPSMSLFVFVLVAVLCSRLPPLASVWPLLATACENISVTHERHVVTLRCSAALLRAVNVARTSAASDKPVVRRAGGNGTLGGGVVRWWRLGFSHLPTLAGSFPRYLLASVLLLLLDSWPHSRVQTPLHSSLQTQAAAGTGTGNIN